MERPSDTEPGSLGKGGGPGKSLENHEVMASLLMMRTPGKALRTAQPGRITGQGAPRTTRPGRITGILGGGEDTQEAKRTLGWSLVMARRHSVSSLVERPLDTEPTNIDENGDLGKSLKDHKALASLSLPTGVKSAYRPHRNWSVMVQSLRTHRGYFQFTLTSENYHQGVYWAGRARGGVLESRKSRATLYMMTIHRRVLKMLSHSRMVVAFYTMITQGVLAGTTSVVVSGMGGFSI